MLTVVESLGILCSSQALFSKSVNLVPVWCRHVRSKQRVHVPHCMSHIVCTNDHWDLEMSCTSALFMYADIRGNREISGRVCVRNKMEKI